MSAYTSRGVRALSQPMYLMSALRAGDDWNFLVQGSRATNYNVHFDPEAMHCTCPDYAQRGEVCKHIYFIVGRVLSDVTLMHALETDRAGADEVFAAGFSERMAHRLRARLDTEGTAGEGTAEGGTAGEGTAGEGATTEGTTGEGTATGVPDCVVCFEPLPPAAWRCHCCRQQCLHLPCAERWFKRTPSCPLCRAPTRGAPASRAGDPLVNFKSFFS